MTDDTTTDDSTSSADPIRTGVAQLESEERLDAIAAAIDPLAKTVSAGALGRVLRGDWLGHALHPALTDLPIGCWLAAGVLDVVGGRRSRPAATRLLGLGLLAVPPTVASGLAEFGTTDEGAVRRVAAAHAIGNTGATVMYLLSWRARRRGHHLRGMVWSLGGGGLVLAASYLGGHLAFVQGVGSGERVPAHDVSDPGVSLLRSADSAGAPIDATP
jgi:uncharacterized membrane protein